jgi:hypothetical protein
MFLFALAQEVGLRDIGQAFQASSPKNFHGLAFGPALFFARAIAMHGSLSLVDAHPQMRRAVDPEARWGPSSAKAPDGFHA